MNKTMRNLERKMTLYYPTYFFRRGKRARYVSCLADYSHAFASFLNSLKDHLEADTLSDTDVYSFSSSRRLT